MHRPAELALAEPKLLLLVLVAPVDAAPIQEVGRSSSAALAVESKGSAHGSASLILRGTKLTSKAWGTRIMCHSARAK